MMQGGRAGVYQAAPIKALPIRALKMEDHFKKQAHISIKSNFQTLDCGFGCHQFLISEQIEVFKKYFFHTFLML